MKLDYSKVLACIEKSRGHWGHWGQPINTRLSASPNPIKKLGTVGDRPAKSWHCLGALVTEDKDCPQLSPICPPLQNGANPYIATRPPLSPVSPVFLGEFEKTTTCLPTLCNLLGLSWGQVEGNALSPEDCDLMDSGHYGAFWSARYLLSWQAGDCVIPFGLLADDVVRKKIEQLGLSQPQDGDSVREWLAVNINKKTEVPQ